MSVLKRKAGRRRHMGRRVAGTGLGVALIVLGLQAPAYAVPPTISSFAPTSGPADCVVQITGTNFTNPIVTDVEFNGTDAADFVIKSDTEIWATTPAGVTSGPITVDNADPGEGTSAVGFVVATPGGCGPTITSFTPTCGPAGTHVTITGTNLMRSSSLGALVGFSPIPPGPLASETTPATPPTLTSRTVVVPAAAQDGPIGARTFNAVVGEGIGLSTTPFNVGTCITEISPTSGNVGSTVTITGVGFEGTPVSVTFTGAGGTQVQAIFTVTSNTPTTDTITATVPFGAVTGPITVVAPGGTAKSADFTVGPGPVTDHSRNVSLKLKGSLTMKGKVTVPDGFTDCANAVPVKLQKKKKGGGWKTLKTVTTSATGAYSGKVANKPGKYRSVAPRTTAADETCLKAVSPTRKN